MVPVTHIVFCDLDGTVTGEESFVRVLKTFSPALSGVLIPRMISRTMSLREGVRAILESIESRHYPEMLASVRNTPLRAGFREFVDFLGERGIPIVIVTAGVEALARTILGGFATRVYGLYGLDLDTGSEYLKVRSGWESETELVSKPAVIRHVLEKTGGGVAIAIGDSVTDFEMALACPVVFARDRLPGYLLEEGKSFFPFGDFFDVMRILKKSVLA